MAQDSLESCRMLHPLVMPAKSRAIVRLTAARAPMPQGVMPRMLLRPLIYLANRRGVVGGILRYALAELKDPVGDDAEHEA